MHAWLWPEQLNYDYHANGHCVFTIDSINVDVLLLPRDFDAVRKSFTVSTELPLIKTRNQAC